MSSLVYFTVISKKEKCQERIKEIESEIDGFKKEIKEIPEKFNKIAEKYNLRRFDKVYAGSLKKSGKFDISLYKKMVEPIYFKKSEIEKMMDSLLEKRDTFDEDSDDFKKIQNKINEKLSEWNLVRNDVFRLDSSITRYSNLGEYIQSCVKKLNKEFEKIDSLTKTIAASFGDLNNCLKELSEKISRQLFIDEKRKQTEIKVLFRKSGSSSETEFSKWLVKNNYEGNLVLLLKKTESEMKEDAEKYAKGLVVEMDARCASMSGGEIIKTDGIHIGMDGSLNGFLVGVNNKRFTVRTIIAGGYNIQCRHFRVIVNPV